MNKFEHVQEVLPYLNMSSGGPIRVGPHVPHVSRGWGVGSHMIEPDRTCYLLGTPLTYRHTRLKTLPSCSFADAR